MVIGTGRRIDPQYGHRSPIYLTGIPQLPNLPLELQVWLKVETDLFAVEAEIRAARSLAAERPSTLTTLGLRSRRWSANAKR